VWFIQIKMATHFSRDKIKNHKGTKAQRRTKFLVYLGILVSWWFKVKLSRFTLIPIKITVRSKVLGFWCRDVVPGLWLLVLATVLTGCGVSVVHFPFDPGGRSLNSPFADITPRIVGRYLVFASDRRGSQDIYLYDTVTRSLIDLPGLNEIDVIESNPSISENGRYIVFVGSREGRSDIFLYDRETRQVRNVSQNLKAEVRNPTISADGNAIAFESSASGQWDILLYNRNGQPINIPIPPR
jgi:Tol biopolymer transport system component